MSLELTIPLVFGSAFFIQSIFGFGGAFISVLILSMILPMHSVLGMVPIVITTANLVSVLADMRYVRFGPPLQIFLKSLPGLLLGGILLHSISGDIMILIASVLILLYCTYVLSGKEIRISGLLELPLSSFAGFIGMITGVWATFVPIMRSRIKEPEVFRSSILFLWICIPVVMIPIYISRDMFTKSGIISTLWSIPAVIISSWLGRQLLKKINPAMFTRLLILLLILISTTRILMLFL